jgi:HAD-hyrolase-like
VPNQMSVVSPGELSRHLRETEARTLCVDIFDTLVYRTIHPDDTKRLASALLAKLYGAPNLADLFHRLRTVAERTLCVAAEATHGELEFSFTQLPAAMHRYAARAVPRCRDDLAAFERNMQTIELAVEGDVLRRDDEVCGAIEAARAEGRTVVGISDFYLPVETLSALLAKLGVLPLLDRLYVSCDHMKTKRSGRLYEHVIADLGLDPAKTVMVGDNPISDGQNAREKGLSALVIDRSQRTAHYAGLREELGTARDGRARFAALCRGTLEGTPPGGVFEELALSLFLFTRRLDAAVRSQGLTRLHFLSREGQFLLKLWEAYQELTPGLRDRPVRAGYLYVSRRSTFPGTLSPLMAESFETLFRQYRSLSPGMFLASLGVDDARAAALCGRLGLDRDTLIEDFPASPALATLLASPEFTAVYDAVRERQAHLLRGYLEQEFGEDETIAVVDVGWKGTIQDHLRLSLSPRRRLIGFYCGLTGHGMALPGNEKRPLLFSFAGELARAAATFGQVRQLFEANLLADHGSVRGYAEEGGRFVPVLETQPEEAEMYARHAAPLQQRLLAVFRALAADPSFIAMPDAELEALAEAAHMRIIDTPTRAEVAWHGAQRFYENFGKMEVRSLVETPATARAQMLKAFFLDRQRFEAEAGEWPAIHLHRHGFPALARFRARQAQRRRAGKAERLEGINALLSAKVDEYALGMDRMSSILLNHESALRSQARMIEERWAVMQNMEKMIQERDEAIKAQGSLLEQRWTIMENNGLEIAEKNNVILENAKIIAELKSKIEQLQDQIMKLRDKQ